MKFLIALAAAFYIAPLILGASLVWSGCGDPVPDGLVFGPDKTVGSFTQRRGTFTGSDYVPSCSPVPHVATISYQASGSNLVPNFRLPGSNPYPTSCETPDLGYAVGTVQIDVCASHYPDLSYCGGYDWGISYYDDDIIGTTHGNRAAETLAEVYRQLLPSLDFNAGVYLSGASLGGYRASALAMAMEDDQFRKFITYLDLQSTGTDLDDTSRYGADSLEAIGDYDLAKVDFSVQAAAGRLDNQFWRYTLSNTDTAVIINAGKKASECDRHKVKCKILMHPFGHSLPPTSAIPPGSAYRSKYNGQDEDHRLNLPVVVFTSATSNTITDTCDYCAYGFGTTYDSEGIIDNTAWVVVPIKYIPILEDEVMPPMPSDITVDYTVRPRKFPLIAGQTYRWEYDGKSGTIVPARDGEATVYGISMSDNDDYKNIVIRHE